MQNTDYLNTNGSIRKSLPKKFLKQLNFNQLNENIRNNKGKGSVEVTDEQNVFPPIKNFCLKPKLDKFWTNSLIPDNYREAFLNSIEGLNAKEYECICERELKLLKENCASVQQIETTKFERSELILRIRNKCKLIAKSPAILKNSSSISDICDLLLNLRNLTLQLVEAHIKFSWQLNNNYKNKNSKILIQQNYFEDIDKIVSSLHTNTIDDISFIIKSPLASKFRLKENDPFLETASKEGIYTCKQKFPDSQKYHISSKSFQAIPLSKDQASRIQKAKFFLENKPEKYFQLCQELHNQRGLQENAKYFHKNNLTKDFDISPNHFDTIQNYNYNINVNLDALFPNGETNFELSQNLLKNCKANHEVKNEDNVNKEITKHFSLERLPNFNIVRMEEEIINRNLARYISTKSLDNYKNSRMLLPLHIKQCELPSLQETYFSKLSNEMRESFIDAESIFSDLKLYKGKLMLSYNVAGRIEGLVIIGLQNKETVVKSANILSATVINENNYLDFLKEVIKYIQVNIPCKVIRVLVKLINVNNCRKVYPFILQTLKKDLNFRWVSHGRESSCFLAKFQKANNIKLSNMKFFSPLVDFYNSCTLAFSNYITNNNSELLTDTFEISCKIEAIRGICENNKKAIQNISGDIQSPCIQDEDCIILNSDEEILKCSKQVFHHKVSSMLCQNSVFNDLTAYLAFMGASTSDHGPQEFGLLNHKALISLVSQRIQFSYDSFDFSLYEIDSKKYKFVRIMNKIQTKKIDRVNIFILSTSDPRIETFIIQDLDFYNHNGLYYIVDLLKDYETFPEIDSPLWIPAFSKKEQTTKNRINLMQTSEGTLHTLNEDCNLKLNFEDQISEFIELKIQENSIILNGSFIFGIIDKEIYKVLKMPISYTIVRKEDWL